MKRGRVDPVEASGWALLVLVGLGCGAFGVYTAVCCFGVVRGVLLVAGGFGVAAILRGVGRLVERRKDVDHGRPD